MTRLPLTMKRSLILLVVYAMGAADSKKTDLISYETSPLREPSRFSVEPDSAVAAFVKRESDDLAAMHPSSLFGISVRGGGFSFSALIPAGYNPFGYKITELGEKFLEFDGSLDSDVGRFLASLKSRKRFEELKNQWLEIVRVSKSGQTMRIYRTLDDLISFCIKARLVD